MYTNLGISLADGCPKNGAKPNPISAKDAKNARGGVRCCKIGHKCQSKCTSKEEKVTLAEAQARCAKIKSGWHYRLGKTSSPIFLPEETRHVLSHFLVSEGIWAQYKMF